MTDYKESMARKTGVPSEQLDREVQEAQGQIFKFGPTRYRVETLNIELKDRLQVIYVLRGPKGGEYGLLRFQGSPDKLYAINLRSFTSSTPFQGHIFTDKDGKLEVQAH